MRKLKIALMGYGKMGKEIEQQALDRGHEILLRLDHANIGSFDKSQLKNADVAIEFSTPHSAFHNIMMGFDAGIPVVCGTTGWLDRLQEVKARCLKENLSFFYASNYSIGVNLFFELNKKLAALMKAYPSYEAEMEEIHHTQKLDAPSGTAITLANDLIGITGNHSGWTSFLKDDSGSGRPEVRKDQLLITSLRVENVPGTHTIRYASDVDSIEIKHTAFSRKGFASGAVIAAEWIVGRKGVFGMNDMLNIS
jgi:4-hydroxy-tetrahydrodipicolinate reductase